MDINKYENGQCHICRKETEVRWKNIYHRGSEGLDICWECEKELLRYIEDKKHEFFKKRKQDYINKKTQRKSI